MFQVHGDFIVVNNTFSGLTYGRIEGIGGSPDEICIDTLVVQNNLFYNVTNPVAPASGYEGTITWNHNGYFATDTTDTDVHKQSSKGNPFVGSAMQDYRLLYCSGSGCPIDNGTNLGPSYATDIFGVPRPQGSGWDIGAYEYVEGGDTTPPGVPTGLTVN